MTREEAIEDLLRYYTGESTDMAIKALKQEPCCNCIEFKRYAKEMGFEIEQDPCEKAVSVQDCINAIENTDCELSPQAWEEITSNIMSLPPVTPVQRWIPISERLPNPDEYIKNNGLFNVSDGNRSYSEWFDIYDKKRFGEPTMDGFRVDRCVTAWMPLPEPYKAEMENKDEND